MFICNSSGASNPFSCNSFARCVKSVHIFQSPSRPPLLISSGVVAFCHTWIVSPNASLASLLDSSNKSTNFWFAGLKASFWTLCFADAIDCGLRYVLRTTARTLLIISLVEPFMFCKRLWRISPRARKEVVNSVIFSQLVLNFEPLLEKVFDQFILLRFPVKRWHRCVEQLWQIGKSIKSVLRICRIVVVRQLLKSQHNLVCFGRRRCVFTADLRLTGRAVFLLLFWRCTGGAVCDFFVNSFHHLVVFLWATVNLALVDARYRMRITLAVVFTCSLVCAISFPFCRKLNWYSLLVIWEHSSFVPSFSCDVPHNSPCWVREFFSFSSQLPFFAGKIMMNDYFLIVFFAEGKSF